MEVRKRPDDEEAGRQLHPTTYRSGNCCWIRAGTKSGVILTYKQHVYKHKGGIINEDAIDSILKVLDDCSQGMNYTAWYGMCYFPKAQSFEAAFKVLQDMDQRDRENFAKYNNRYPVEASTLAKEKIRGIDQSNFWREFTDRVLFIERTESEYGSNAEIRQQRQTRRELIARLHEQLDGFLAQEGIRIYEDESYNGIVAIWSLQLLAVSSTHGTLALNGSASD